MGQIRDVGRADEVEFGFGGREGVGRLLFSTGEEGGRERKGEGRDVCGKGTQVIGGRGGGGELATLAGWAARVDWTRAGRRWDRPSRKVNSGVVETAWAGR